MPKQNRPPSPAQPLASAWGQHGSVEPRSHLWFTESESTLVGGVWYSLCGLYVLHYHPDGLVDAVHCEECDRLLEVIKRHQLKEQLRALSPPPRPHPQEGVSDT